ncbi:MAG: D-alanyl-D-alanine carboxypeptidase [Ruminococcaceae bacterium]|nr:D-alanyl-D-alanine carboxypeptidase [Oscillospiraceae bacterium]
MGSSNYNRSNYGGSRGRGGRWPSKTYWIVLFATIALLVLVTAALVIALCVEGKQNGPDRDFGGNVNNGQNNNANGGVVNNGTGKLGAKTQIKLPCATSAGSFKSSSDASVVSIEGIESQSAILVNLNSGTSTAEKSADTVIYPASMTKVMTVLVACENAKDPNAKLTVTEAMVQYQQSMGGSSIMAFKAGESITVEDALYLINYNSDTIACLLIAEHIAQSEAGFVAMMNNKAKSLGLTSTNFVNCTGLHDANHYTTAREMAAIMACAMKNETAKKIITAYAGYSVYVYVNGDVDRSPTVYSGWFSTRLGDNNWAGKGSDVKIYGGKTGYEDIPTSCFVTYAQNTETKTEYICVTVGRISKDQPAVSNAESTEDTKKIYQVYGKN